MLQTHLTNAESLRKQRAAFRVKLLNHFLLVGLLSAILQLFINIFVGVGESSYTELSFIAILLTLFLINKKGYFSLARIGTLLIINSAIYITYKLEPTGGIQYFYFPMLVLSLVLHDPKDWVKSLIYGFLPVFLFLYDSSKFLGDRDIISVLINFSTASVVSSIAIIYLIRANNNIENLLIKANQEVSEVGEELRVKNKILAKTNDELDKFMYSSSHDLRAPLSSILGLVNLAKLEPMERHADYIEMIRDRVIGLDYFIKDIIDFSKNSNTDMK